MNFLNQNPIRGKESAAVNTLVHKYEIMVAKLEVIDSVRDILFESKGISTEVVIEFNIKMTKEEFRLKIKSITLELNNIEMGVKYCDMHVLGKKIVPLLAKHNLGIFVFFDSLPDGDRIKIRLSGEMFESCLPTSLNCISDHNNLKLASVSLFSSPKH